jgi:hypothetical protein
MNKLLILLLLSTPLFAQVDLIVIEDKELVIEGSTELFIPKEGYQKIILRRMIFYSDGNYATIRENQAYYAKKVR